MSISGLSPVVQYITAIKDEQAAADTYVKTDPTTKRYMDDFCQKGASIKSTNQLMRDYAANQVILGAYNLSSIAKQPALEKKLLTENPYYSKSTSATSHNAAWTSFADVFYNISTTTVTLGMQPDLDTTTPILNNNIQINNDFIEQTIQSYKYNLYENSESLKNNGVGNALYFTRQLKSGNIKSIDDILTDPKLLNVVETVYGYNNNDFENLTYDQQKNKLSTVFDIKSFTDTENNPDIQKIKNFAESYLGVFSDNLESDSINSYDNNLIDQYRSIVDNEQGKADGYVMSNQQATDDINNFRNNAESITTVEQLIGDDSSNRVVLGAYNLDSLAQESDSETERKLLLENPYYASSTVETASNTPNSAYQRNFAKAIYNIKLSDGTMSMLPEKDRTSKTLSGGIIMSPDFIDDTANLYELRQYENSKDLQKSGVGNALYFTRTMNDGKIKTVNDLMSDPTLLKVVEVVNGYNPDDIGALSFTQQQNLVKRIFNINDFTKPDPSGNGSDDRIPDMNKIQRYAERYLAMLQIHPEYNSVDQAANILDLFGGDDSEDGILALFS